jgi:tetratricopeptide (TPR) repeat protein
MEKVRREPRSAETWGRLGKVLFGHGLPDAAQPCFREAERLDPENPRWPYFQGLFFCRFASGDPIPPLRRAADRAARSDPGNLTPRLVLAERLLLLGLTDQAEEQLARAAEQAPMNPRLRYNQGMLAMQREEWARARDRLLPLANDSRCSPAVQGMVSAQLALIYQALHQPDRAEEHDRRAPRTPPDMIWEDSYQTEAAHLLAPALRGMQEISELEKKGQHAQAVAKLREEIAMGNAGDEEYLALGNNLLHLNRLAEAEPCFRRAVALNPNKGANQDGLCVVLYTQARQRAQVPDHDREGVKQMDEEALTHARKAAELRPADGFALYRVALCCQALHRHAEALPVLRKALLCRPEAPSLHLALAEALFELEQFEEAEREAERATQSAEASGQPDEKTRNLLEKIRRKKGAQRGNPAQPEKR